MENIRIIQQIISKLKEIIRNDQAYNKSGFFYIININERLMMLFKVYYCDSSVRADEVYQVFLKQGYKTAICDCDDGVTFDIFPNKTDYTRNRIVINDADGNEMLNESFRFWRNYLVIFEDNTIIALRRDFDPGEHSKRNRDKMDEFINAIREKINQSSAVIIQDDDDDFVV